MKTEQKWKICNCLDGLPEIPDKSVDMILTDLPYGTTACKWDTPINLTKLWSEYERIIKDNGAIVLTASQPFTTILINSNLKLFKYEWIWLKSTSAGFIHAKNKPLKKHENVLIFSKGNTNHESISNNRMKYNPQGLIKVDKIHKRPKAFSNSKNTIIGYRNSHKPIFKVEYENYPISHIKFYEGNNKHINPTQKPVALFEYLIKTYTDEGDMVHDSCLGSGTTLEACMNTNRNCIGFEISNEWEPDYRKRLKLDIKRLDDAYDNP